MVLPEEKNAVPTIPSWIRYFSLIDATGFFTLNSPVLNSVNTTLVPFVTGFLPIPNISNSV